MKKNYFLIGCILGIILEFCVISYETSEQKATNYRVDQARIELSKKQRELKNMAAKVADSQKHRALNQGGSAEKLAKQDTAQAESKKQVRKILKLLYTYDSGDEKLRIPDKIKKTHLVSEKILKSNSMFKDNKQLELQYSGADMTGQVDEMNLQAGLLEDGKVPVYATVYFEMTKDGRTLGTPTDGYQLIYNTETGQITSVEYFGRYQIDREVD